jgi:hypothetical protein
MDTKRILEIILSFCIGWMIYSMLFEKEGHSILSMATLEDLTQGGFAQEGMIADEPGDEEDEANRADEEEEEEDNDYEEAMFKDDDGLMPRGTGL